MKATSTVMLALLLLTFVTGLVDASSVLGLGHVFAANMTGNVVFLGFALAGQKIAAVPASLVALGCFTLGAIAGGRLVNVPTPPVLKVAFALEVALLALAAALALARAAELVLLALLAVSMGLRNALVRKLAVPDMTTTVLTLTLTGLAADSSPAGGANPRWRRRVGALVAMLLGAVVGAGLLPKGLGLVIALATLIEALGAGLLIHPASQDAKVTPEALLGQGGT